MYSIGIFSKKVNLSIHTLRYYEQEGIISPTRDKINKRFYSEEDIIWIDFVKRLKETNMSIKNIKQYSLLRAQGNTTLYERLNLLINHRAQLITEIDNMNNHLSKLDTKIDFYNNLIQN